MRAPEGTSLRARGGAQRPVAIATARAPAKRCRPSRAPALSRALLPIPSRRFLLPSLSCAPLPLPFCQVMAGGAEDVRKLFILTTTQNYFGVDSEPWDPPLLHHSPEINNFLDDGNQMLLRVQRSDAGMSFSNAVRLPAPRPEPCMPPSDPQRRRSGSSLPGLREPKAVSTLASQRLASHLTKGGFPNRTIIFFFFVFLS